ncbi:SPOR domain-containing protein [Aquiflexum sp. TKW24L]|uniref:SPOR domain-containing protein n=1 Tax=Aquiflexum sp. TKW24L TaxID=2942212 RepID=UPI0020BE348F|nr:SPOR domain-containing protein [Aquiflexum sp. TKW24L]MCL6258809.1 SPOR domain-containing protein [Aquiflexum sp. TKW24L]
MEKDPEINPASDDKDYGFPLVKVEPLQNPLPVESVSQPEEVEKISEIIESLPETIPHPANIKFKTQDIPKRKKKNQVPLLFSLVLLILVVLASMAYFLYYLPGQKDAENTALVAEEITEEPKIQPENKVEEVFEPIHDSTASEVVEIPLPQVPASIVSTTNGKLIVLESKEDVRYYHLVVASLPNERIAREEAQVFLNKGKDIWLIFPSGDTRNYRLSVGKYSSFKSATDDLAAAKTDFNESTWILKY